MDKMETLFHALCYLSLKGESGGWGYELRAWIAKHHGMEVRLQDVYEVLGRLLKSEMATVRPANTNNPVEISLAGPSRKYYVLTERGVRACEAEITNRRYMI